MDEERREEEEKEVWEREGDEEKSRSQCGDLLQAREKDSVWRGQSENKPKLQGSGASDQIRRGELERGEIFTDLAWAAAGKRQWNNGFLQSRRGCREVKLNSCFSQGPGSVSDW